MMQQAVMEGETHEVLIQSVGAKGDGVTKIEGLVVFVPEAKRDHTYKVKITKVKEKFAFGEIIEEV